MRGLLHRSFGIEEDVGEVRVGERRSFVFERQCSPGDGFQSSCVCRVQADFVRAFIVDLREVFLCAVMSQGVNDDESFPSTQ